MKEPYRDWAEGHIKRVRDILNASRAEHTQVVKDRIQSVEQMKDVVSVTENLFALSKVRDFVRNVNACIMLIILAPTAGDCKAGSGGVRSTTEGCACG